jgi:DNA-directed RNA polymerase subunit alpha
MTEPIFEVKEEHKKENYASIIITPLEQGYGHTLGNALRRVLLTSLPGAAATSVKISGVRHQFSSLQGMKEDVVEFVLNLKKVRFAYTGDKPVRATISVKGPGEVRAKDIKVSSEVAIANPEALLAYLNKGAKLDATIEIEAGRGYIPAEESERRELGLIPLDASFSPVVRVNYKVEETRVGRLTNFDKLTLEIWTNGTTQPKDALSEAAKILSSYFNQVHSPKKVITKAKEEKTDVLGPEGRLSVEEIGLPTRVANALVKSGHETVEDLVKAKREDLVKVRNLGEKSVKIIEAALGEKDIKFVS